MRAPWVLLACTGTATARSLAPPSAPSGAGEYDWALHTNVNCYPGKGATNPPSDNSVLRGTVETDLGQCKTRCFERPDCAAVTVKRKAGSLAVLCWLQERVDAATCKAMRLFDTHIIIRLSDRPSVPIINASESLAAPHVIAQATPTNPAGHGSGTMSTYESAPAALTAAAPQHVLFGRALAQSSVRTRPVFANWTGHTGYNCYPGRGAVDADTSVDGTGEQSVEPCKRRCEMRSGAGSSGGVACSAFMVRFSRNPNKEGVTCWLRAQVKLDQCETGGKQAPRFQVYLHTLGSPAATQLNRELNGTAAALAAAQQVGWRRQERIEARKEARKAGAAGGKGGGKAGGKAAAPHVKTLTPEQIEAARPHYRPELRRGPSEKLTAANAKTAALEAELHRAHERTSLARRSLLDNLNSAIAAIDGWLRHGNETSSG